MRAAVLAGVRPTASMQRPAVSRDKVEQQEGVVLRLRDHQLEGDHLAVDHEPVDARRAARGEGCLNARAMSDKTTPESYVAVYEAANFNSTLGSQGLTM
jgi:hypothetical protein